MLSRVAPFVLPLLCVAASIPLKLFPSSGGPLWLDEGWTLAIVQQHGAAFLRQLSYDPNPPFYFVTLKAWTALAGVSDGALRTPSVLAAIVGPLFALTPGTGLQRRERWLWLALLSLWIPGVFFAQEARSYGLLFALECATAAAFLRLLAKPTLSEAVAWCGLASLCLLTHHHAFILAALQGFAFLILRREQALKLWPAALLFLPAFAWMGLHAPRVAEFAKPEFAWYPPMKLSDAFTAVDYAFGGRPLWVGGGALAAVGLLWRRWSPSTRAARDLPPSPWLWAPVVCAGLGLLVVVVAGYLRPSFAFRYLTPYGPGLVLTLPLALKALARERAGGFGLLLMSFALFTAGLVAFDPDPDLRRTLQYETASKDLMLARAHHVAFLWDNPTNRVLTREERLALARTFFDRVRYPVTVTPLVTGSNEDPAPLLYAQTPHMGDGFIWLFDREVPRTAATLHPPRRSLLRPDLACAEYAPDTALMGVLACQRRPIASPAAAAAPR